MEHEKRTTFNQVAELYDNVRPHYPEQLFKDLLSLTKLSSDALILEIGAGTGIATLPLAKQGYQIIAIEMGPELASVARKKLAPYRNVDVLTTTFEQWELPVHPLDLVISATAFHWIDQSLRCQKSAAALRTGGSLAVFRYHQVAGGDRDFFEQCQHCFQRYIPGTDPNFHLPEIGDYQSELIHELETSGLFYQLEKRTYISEETYTRQQYIKLLSTYSDHLILEESARKQLFDCIGLLIDQQFNGRIRKCYLTELVVAQKK